MFIQFLILGMAFISSAGTLQSYQEREKAFFEWKALQEKSDLVRKSAAEKQKEQRMIRELEAIRRRQQFRREFRTTANLENDHQEKVDRFEQSKKGARDIFSRSHRVLLDFYEKNVLPLKSKEYELEESDIQKDKK
jgi:hypothetical protein